MSKNFEHLLSPGKIGALQIPNRVVKAPQSTGLSNMDGSVSERLIRHYRALARGGTGMIIVEYAFIDNIASKSAHCQLGISDNEHIPGLAWLAETIKDEGSVPAIQIEHCGRQKFLGTPPIKSASSVAWPALYQRVGNDAVPEELTLAEISAIIEAFGDAAVRAKMAGFELVEIHGAHGYLLTNFLSTHTNKRHDVYGGSLENRMRIVVQVLDNIRSKVGHEFPVTIRLSGTDYEPDGFGIEETIEVARVLEKHGINGIHVSGGDHHQMIHQVSPMAVPVGHNIWAAEAVKAKVNIPVIASGSITLPEFAEEIIAMGKGDFVGLGRPLWADPDWVVKMKAGKADEIRPCIRCNEGCLERTFFSFRSITCGVNPCTGREGELEFTPATQKKKVAVIGGGPAGMEAARVLSLRGHEVTLFEKRDLGGALIEASAPDFKSDIKPLIRYLKRQMKRLQVNVVYKEATFGLIKEGGFEEVIVAVGSEPIQINVPGKDCPNVVEAQDVLTDNAEIGNNVIVIGGGLVGTETALWLDAKGKNVTLIEMLNQIMSDCAVTDKLALSEKLSVSKVKVMTGNRLQGILEDGVLVCSCGEAKEIQSDAVVLAAGYKPLRALYEQLSRRLSIPVHDIGDCVHPGKIFDAIHTAYKTARII